jgi:hypothetical protein
MWGSLARGITATVRETAHTAAESYVPGARDVLRRVGEVVAPPLHDGDGEEEGSSYDADEYEDDEVEEEGEEGGGDDDDYDEYDDDEGLYCVDDSDGRGGDGEMEFEDVIVDDDERDVSAVIVDAVG